MYQCKRFEIYELIPKELYDMLGQNSWLAWGMFDENLLRGIDWLADRYSPKDPVTINNWYWGGAFNQSGLRTAGSKYYSPTSQHSIGKAGDLKFKTITAEEIREDLRQLKYVPLITRVELDVDWLHVDTKHTGKNEIYFFKP